MVRALARGGWPCWVAAKIPARQQPGVTSLILGATKVEQLQDNIASLAVTLTPGQIGKLNAASEPDLVHPYMFFTGMLRRDRVFGGTDVTGWL